jgi:hypothetical protein
VISRLACRAISARRRTTAHITVVSSVSKQSCLLCAYEHDFGDNYIITIVKTGLTTKKYVIVFDFVKCNRPIGGIS